MFFNKLPVSLSRVRLPAQRLNLDDSFILHDIQGLIGKTPVQQEGKGTYLLQNMEKKSIQIKINLRTVTGARLPIIRQGTAS